MRAVRLAPFVCIVALPHAAHRETADLKPHTLEAFLRYARATETEFLTQVHAADDILRVYSDDSFEERDEAVAAIESGDVFVTALETLEEGERIEVKNGLIHHWYGVVKVPGVGLDEVLTLVKSYDLHEDVFAPDVERSEILEGTPGGDVFDVRYRFRKKKVITVVLETEHHVEYTRLSPTRAYSMSRTTKVQEVDDPDGRNEPKAPDTGRGFMWRINSYWRFEERNGDTVIECESISLTRDIPFLLRPMIGPFVNGVPRDTLNATLQNALAALSATAAGHGGTPPFR